MKYEIWNHYKFTVFFYKSSVKPSLEMLYICYRASVYMHWCTRQTVHHNGFFFFCCCIAPWSPQLSPFGSPLHMGRKLKCWAGRRQTVKPHERDAVRFCDMRRAAQPACGVANRAAAHSSVFFSNHSPLTPLPDWLLHAAASSDIGSNNNKFIDTMQS